MRPSRFSQRNETGAVAILVAVSLLAMFAVMAMVVDIGMAYGKQRDLQNAADAAALAAGAVLIEESIPGQNCTTMTAEPARGMALAEARATFNENAAAGMQLVGGDVAITCVDVGWEGRIVVSADAALSQRSIFGSAMGVGSYELSKPAKALVAPAETLRGLRPFGLCDPLAALARTAPDSHLGIDLTNRDIDCGTASGNFGILDFSRFHTTPPTATGGGCPGVPDVRDWIEFGYGGNIPTATPIYVEGDPGAPSTDYQSQFTEILDQPIVIPHYVNRTGSGCASSVYEVTGFSEVKVCGFQLSPALPQRRTGLCFDSAAAPATGEFVQLQFVRFIPLGTVSRFCRLGDTCDIGTPLLSLAD